MIDFIIWLIFSQPPERHFDKCPGSHPVIVDGEFMECVNDKSQSSANTWTP